MLKVCVKLAGKGGKTTIWWRKNCDKNRLQLLRCYERYTGGWWRIFPSFSISFWSSISILALKSFILHFNFHNIPIYEEMVLHRFSVTQSLEARSTYKSPACWFARLCLHYRLRDWVLGNNVANFPWNSWSTIPFIIYNTTNLQWFLGILNPDCRIINLILRALFLD